ncbi:MAG: HEAT repeat domain-containing protein, partial [Candidatus Omnitrophota bacterium]
AVPSLIEIAKDEEKDLDTRVAAILGLGEITPVTTEAINNLVSFIRAAAGREAVHQKATDRELAGRNIIVGRSSTHETAVLSKSEEEKTHREEFIAGEEFDGKDEFHREVVEKSQTREHDSRRIAYEEAAAREAYLRESETRETSLRKSAEREAAIRETAVEALVKIGPSAKPIFMQLLADDEEYVREAGAHAIAKISPDAVQELISIICATDTDTKSKNFGRDYYFRRYAAKELVKIGPEAVFALMENLESRDPRSRKAVESALGIIGEEPVIEAAVHVFAAKGPEVIPVLVNLAKSEHYHIRLFMARAIRKVGPEAISALAEELNSGKDSDLSHAADALGEVGPDAALAADRLEKLLENEMWWVRNSAFGALKKIGALTLERKKKKFRKDSEDKHSLAYRLSGKKALEELEFREMLGGLGGFVPVFLAQGTLGNYIRTLISKLEELEAANPTAFWVIAGAAGILLTAGVILAARRALRPKRKRYLRMATGEILAERVKGIKGLAELRDRKDLAGLCEALKNDDSPEVREAAAEAIGMFSEAGNTMDVRDVLESALMDPVKSVRATALEAILNIGIGPRAAAEALTVALSESNPLDVREDAAVYLGALGESHRDDVDTIEAIATGLALAMKDENTSIRRAVMRSFNRLAHPRVVGFLAIMLSEDADADIRCEAAEALARTDSPYAVIPLTEAMIGDADSTVRKAATRAVADICAQIKGAPIVKDKVVPVFVEALGDRDKEVRKRVALEFPSIAAPDVLEQVLGPDYQEILEGYTLAAKGELENIGSKGMPALTAALKDNDSSVREAAARRLGELDLSKLIPHVAEALEDPDESVRESAVRVLGDFGDRRAIGLLNQAFYNARTGSSVHAAVREALKKSLMKFVSSLDMDGDKPDKGTTQILFMAVKSDDSSLHEAAAKHIARLDPLEALSSLEKHLTHEGPSVRSVAVNLYKERALKYLSSGPVPSAAPRIVRVLADAGVKDEDTVSRLKTAVLSILDTQPETMVIIDLVAALKGNYDPVFDAVMERIERSDFSQLFPHLVNATSSPKEDIRHGAVLILGRFREEKVIALLERIIGREDPGSLVHITAMETLEWSLIDLICAHPDSPDTERYKGLLFAYGNEDTVKKLRSRLADLKEELSPGLLKILDELQKALHKKIDPGLETFGSFMLLPLASASMYGGAHYLMIFLAYVLYGAVIAGVGVATYMYLLKRYCPDEYRYLTDRWDDLKVGSSLRKQLWQQLRQEEGWKGVLKLEWPRFKASMRRSGRWIVLRFSLIVSYFNRGSSSLQARVRLRAIRELVEYLLTDENYVVRRKAIERIGDQAGLLDKDVSLGDDFIRVLLDEKIIRSPESTVRIAAVKALDKLSRGWKNWLGMPDSLRDPMIGELETSLSDKEPEVRKVAWKVLRDLNEEDEGLIRALTEALKSDDVSVRRDAIAMIMKVKENEGAIKPLLERLTDPNRQVRLDAAGTVCNLTHKIAETQEEAAAVERVKDILMNNDEVARDAEFREIAVNILGNIGYISPVRLLKVTLLDESWRVRRNSAEALGRIAKCLIKTPMGQDIAEVGYIITYLTEALNDKNRLVRKAAADTLLSMDYPAMVKAGIVPSQFEQAKLDRILRGYIFAADKKWEDLGWLGEDAVPALIGELNDEHDPARQKAARSLGDMAIPDPVLNNNAVEALLKRLAGEDDPYVHAVYIHALGKLGDTRALEPLRNILLSDERPFMRMVSIEALGILGSQLEENSIEKGFIYKTLIARLYIDKGTPLISPMVWTLSKMGGPNVVELLITTLKGKNPEGENGPDCMAAVTVLGNLAGEIKKDREPKERTIKTLLPFLSSGNAELRDAAANVLSSLGTTDERLAMGYAEALKSKYSAARKNAAYVLGVLAYSLGPDAVERKEVIKALLEILAGDPDMDARMAAFYSVNKLEATYKQQARAYIKQVHNENMEIRRHAVKSLASYAGILKSPRAVAYALMEAMADPEADIRQTAAEGLRSRTESFDDPEPETVLYSNLYHGNIDAVVAAGKGNVDFLIEVLDSGPKTRKSAIQALGGICQTLSRDPEDVPVREKIVSVLNEVETQTDQDTIYREHAVYELSQIAPAESIPNMIDALKDANDYIRQTAAITLGNIGDAKTVEPLIEAYEAEGQQAQIRREIVHALAKIGGGKAVNAVVKALKDGAIGVRKVAARDLGTIAAKTGNVKAMVYSSLFSGEENWIIRILVGKQIIHGLIDILEKGELPVRLDAMEHLKERAIDFAEDVLFSGEADPATLKCWKILNDELIRTLQDHKRIKDEIEAMQEAEKTAKGVQEIKETKEEEIKKQMGRIAEDTLKEINEMFKENAEAKERLEKALAEKPQEIGNIRDEAMVLYDAMDSGPEVGENAKNIMCQMLSTLKRIPKYRGVLFEFRRDLITCLAVVFKSDSK